MIDLDRHPGLWFVLATLLPLASFVFLLILGGIRHVLRPHAKGETPTKWIYEFLGGDVTGRGPAYVALAAIALAFVCSFIGFVTLLGEHDVNKALEVEYSYKSRLQDSIAHADDAKEKEKLRLQLAQLESKYAEMRGRWAGSAPWAVVWPQSQNDPQQSTKLFVGYRIDHLAAIMFVMVTFVATLIHLFSMGYMSEELQQKVEDHEVHTAHGHLQRRGRFGQFFLYMSLFCFSMLNLVLADNLFQVFVSWELVGVCSYLLIGFYYERTSASNAANKAFITNRIGDAGFIIGVLILWTYVGSLNFEDIERRLRCPPEHSHGPSSLAHQFVRAQVPERTPEQVKNDKSAGRVRLEVMKPGEAITWNTHVVLMPREIPGHFHAPGLDEKHLESSTVFAYENPRPGNFGAMPYWMLVVAGLGIFLGCVGKSAQFPLQVWLPDAMEGPTPVSALIHAATMVAAGVYLVGRTYFLFTPEVLLTIAYTGAITLFIAATIAVVMTDIKKVLAYSTVSQLGYMMLGLGVGGWVAGLFHLITHAFFKALMFLASGSVIYGCHHVQEMTRMGGLYSKMKITALTMLVGCLAIAGIPLFSGWYSKDAILANSMGFALVNSQHFLLFLLPLLTAGLTTFYMFRMWFMTFAGKPRDEHVHEHAHETPWTMTLPLVVLAFFSVTVAWGWPMWNPEASWLEHQMHEAQPRSVQADFGGGFHAAGAHAGHGHGAEAAAQAKGADHHEDNVLHKAHEVHGLAGNLALLVVAIGLSFAFAIYYFGLLDPAEAKEQFPGVHSFLQHKWYFDELYSAILVRPGLTVSNWAKSFDLNVIDGFVHWLSRVGVFLSWVHGLCDKYIVDGIANLLANVSYGIGAWLRGIQTGYLRSYVLFLVLAAVGIWVVLTFLMGPAAGAP